MRAGFVFTQNSLWTHVSQLPPCRGYLSDCRSWASVKEVHACAGDLINPEKEVRFFSESKRPGNNVFYFFKVFPRWGGLPHPSSSHPVLVSHHLVDWVISKQKSTKHLRTPTEVVSCRGLDRIRCNTFGDQYRRRTMAGSESTPFRHLENWLEGSKKTVIDRVGRSGRGHCDVSPEPLRSARGSWTQPVPGGRR